jgi:uncharacterized protein (DUF58 family)
MRRASVAAGLGLTLCLVAGGFAAAPLYLPGVALLLITAGAAAWVSLAARGLQVVRSMEVATVEENAPLHLTVRVLRSRIPLPGAEVRAWPGARALPLSGSNDAIATIAARYSRRGRHRLGPAAALISDPLGLCRRTAYSSAEEVLVLPRIEPVRLTDLAGQAGVLGRKRASAAGEGATEVDSLRPHRPGAPASRIHWPTVARTTTLMERRLVADDDRRPLVVVDPREPSSADALDQAMRAAASLCVHLARQGGCALLLPGDRRPARIDPELHGFPQLHSRLALLAPDAGAPPLGCLAGADAVLWVTAATGRPAAIAQLRAQVRYLVSPHPQARWPVQFTVAGCGGQRLERAAAMRRFAA